MLKVFTSKRKGNPSRLVPLPENTADALVGYVETSRRILMRKLEKERWVYRSKMGFLYEAWPNLSSGNHNSTLFRS